MRHAAWIVLGILITAQPASAQPVPAPPGIQPAPAPMPRDGAVQRESSGTAQMSGRVTDAETGKPLRRALVQLMAPNAPQPRMVSTDADGRWQLRSLPAGSYRMFVSKGGYVAIGYGQRRPFEQSVVVELAEGTSMDKLDVSLPRGGVITGRIFDELGEPMTGMRVMVMRYRNVGGERRLMSMQPSDMTDDIGQYRIHGLPPGDYYVAAVSAQMMAFGQSDDRTSYPQTYYPGTPVQSEAQRVTVAVGHEAAQINFSMAPARVAVVSGTATTSSGVPIRRGFVSLTDSGTHVSLGSPIRPDGTFTLSNVAPGNYQINLQYMPDNDGPVIGPPSSRGAEYATAAITVGSDDIKGLALVTAPGAVVRGRIVFEDGAPPPGLTPTSLGVAAFPATLAGSGAGGNGRVRDDWTFEFTAAPERRLMRVGSLPPTLRVKSILYDGADVVDTGLDLKEAQVVADVQIVVTSQVPELSGTALDGGRQSNDYTAVAFSSDSAKWGFQSRYVRSAKATQDGRFSIKGLPPDEYLVVALEYVELGSETDPEQLEKWRPLAARVTLSDSGASPVRLKLNK